jgi:endogenous inhibitor of DNA gyrase (YacG/DUF329 family)
MNTPPLPRKPSCARCRKHPVIAEYRPFCSKRCADADLGSWLNGAYAISGAPAEDADDNPDRPGQTHGDDA